MNALLVLKIFTWRIVKLGAARSTETTYCSFTRTMKKHWLSFTKNYKSTHGGQTHTGSF